MVQQVVDFLASLFADTEMILHPDAVILPDFTRCIQLFDNYSCGAKSVFTILRYYSKICTPESVEEQLHTDEDGTSVSDIKRVLKRYGLAFQTLRKPGLRDLKAAIDDGCPILITLNDGEHYAVVYGYSSSHIFVSNPSLNILTGYGSIRCAIPKIEIFRIINYKMFDCSYYVFEVKFVEFVDEVKEMNSIVSFFDSFFVQFITSAIIAVIWLHVFF
jgi:hypothetical protein